MYFGAAQASFCNAKRIPHGHSTGGKVISESGRGCCLRLNSFEDFLIHCFNPSAEICVQSSCQFYEALNW